MKFRGSVKKLAFIFSILFILTLISNVEFFTYFKTVKVSNIDYKQGGEASAPRIKKSFNYDWKFAKGTGKINNGSTYASSPVQTQTVINTSETPYSSSYTLDSRWKNVSLPHTFNDEDTFDKFTETGMNGERSMYTGTAWYIKEFTIPASYEGKRIYLEFEAARQAAEVYLNGEKLTGKYENGFIPFGYDLTSKINYGGSNKITVMVDNSFPYYMSEGNSDSIKWHDSHWHPNYGGLYRNSYLYVMDDLHLTLPLYSFTSGEGTYVYSDEETNTSAKIHVDAQVENSGSDSQDFYVRAKVKNKSGDVVATMNSTKQTLETNGKSTVKLNTTISNPKRWSTKYPYLYTVDTEIYQQNEQEEETIIDNNSASLGIRTFRMTNDYGFYLNNNYTELNGWGQKTTNEWAGLGAAYPNWMQDYVIKLMKDANANYIRWGHVAASPKQIESADKYGILVTQPGVDGEGGSSYTQKTLALRIEAFRDMLIRYRNNPSIIMWEVGNQADIMSTTMNSTSVSGITGLNYSSSTGTVIQLLTHLINEYDYGNREQTISNAGSYDSSTEASTRLCTIRRGNEAVKNYVDVGESTEGSGSMNTSTLGNKPAVEGEYNRLEVRRGVWDFKSKGFLNFFNTTTYGDEYKYVTNEEFAKAQISKKKSVLLGTNYVGGANWIFSDTISHGRVTSEVSRASGEVDAVMLPKESYYVNKVIYGSGVGMHIIGHWNYPSGTNKDIFVAAKGVSSVDLYINNVYVSTGVVSSDYLYTFENVDYESGTLKAVGKDINGDVVIEKTKTTHGTPDHIVLSKKQSSEGLRANGSDIVIVDAEIVDADGNRCTSYDGVIENDQLHFNITDANNAFVYRGGYNSSIENSTNSEDIYVEAGIARVALRTTLNTGTVSITASSDEGLSTESALTATSTQVDNTNGLCELDTDTAFEINDSDDPGIGNGAKPGSQITVAANSSVLITNFSYTGTTNINNKIEDAFSPGKTMYSDTSETFTTIPYKYYNAEYLKLPNEDNGSSTVDLINFEARRNITVFVLRDSLYITNPSWMNSFTKTNDVIIGGNGVEYDVYKKVISIGDSITMGGNSDDGTSGLTGANNIIMFKESTNTNNNTFFNETFNGFDTATYRAGWNAYIGAGNTVTTDTTVADHAMHFFGESTEDLVYTQKKFAPQTGKFILKYKAYITDNEINKFNRVFLTKDYILNDSDKTQVGAETYLSKDGSVFSLLARKVTDGVAGGTYSLSSSISLNAWHTFEYYVDVENGTFKTKVDDGAYSSNSNFLTTIDSVDTIIFGGGKAYSSDLYFDDVEIIPVVENLITNVKIDNNSISSFQLNKTDYYIPNLTSTSELTFDYNEFYESSTITYNETNDCIDFTVVDINNNSTTYHFYNVGDSDILDSWDVHNATDATIKPGALDDGNVVIHLSDSSETNMAYMQKSIGTNTGKFKISFDAYVTDLATNTWLRVWLTDGDMTSAKTNVGIESYMLRDQNNLKLSYRETANGSTNVATSTTTINAWHNFEYIVNVEAQTYDVYMDNTLILENISFINSQTDINNIVFGTGGSTTSDYYLRNISYEMIYNSPLKGIKINTKNISNYTKENFSYNYYTEDVLSSRTNIELSTETYLKTSNIVKDTTNQTATITVTNTSNLEFSYVIHFLNPSQMNITLLELQNLINDTNSNYVSSNYTNGSWTSLQTSITEGEEIIEKEDPTSEEISTSYYKINKALDNLLLNMDLTTYTSGYIDTIKYSSNYDNNIEFEKVLDNEKSMYKNDESSTFRSVPYKYLNAEYIKLPNTAQGEGEISFNVTKDLYLLVFKDIKSGVLTDDTFTDTGDIATGSNGVVYKVYKKFYTTDSNVIIDTEKLVQNLVTNKNNIIAFKSNYDVNNNKFLHEDFNEYTTSTFKKSWSYSEPTSNVIELVDIDETESVDNTLHLTSSTTSSMPFVFKEYAKIYDKFTLSYKAKTNSEIDNKWNRIWILNGEIADGSSDWRTNVDTKDNVMMETYLSLVNSVYSASYRSSTSSGQNTDKQIGAFTSGQWGSVTYTADVINKNFDATVESSTTTNKTNLSFLDADTKTFNYADYIELGGRKSGNTDVYFDDVFIDPIARTMASSIKIDNNNISNDYTSLTKDYLYCASSINNKSVDVTTTKTKVQNTESNYEDITLTDDDNYEVNHRVYFELATNRKLLTEYVELALSLSEMSYTQSSWDEMIEALNSSKEVLANSEATQSEINASATALKEKIDALIDYNGEGNYYSSDISEGNLLDNNATNNVNITNDSSFTLDTIIDKTITDFPSDVGVRTLKSSAILPTGTQITFIDDSESTPKYYYYEVTSDDISNSKKDYLLSDFIEMGTTTEHYVNKSYYSSNRLKEKMSFIVDFNQATTKLSNGTYNIRLENVMENDTINMDATYYKIYDEKGTYNTEVSMNQEIYQPSDDIILNIVHNYTAASSVGNTIVDTTRFDKKYGIILSLFKDEEKVDLPKGTNVTLGIYKCNVSEGICKIPVSNNIQNFDENITIDPGEIDLLSNGSYDLEIDIVESPDSKNKGNIISTSHQLYYVSKTKDVSFKVELLDTNNIIKYGEEKELTYIFETLNITNKKIVAMLEKKNGNTFDTIDLNSYVRGNLTQFSANNYDLGDEPSWIPTITSNIGRGIYRLTYKLYSGTKIVSIEKEMFIVK